MLTLCLQLPTVRCVGEATVTGIEVIDEDGEVVTDGRRRRGARSREAVVEAMLSLIREGNRRPSSADIAERAGVSVRSVLRHFDDLDSLYALAIERQVAHMAPLLELGELPDALDARIDLLVTRRAGLYEDISPVRHVAERRQASSPVLSDHLAVSRSWLRTQVLEVFAPELDACAAADRKELGEALDAALSWRMWVALREDQGCSAARASATIRRVVASLLA